MNENKNTKGTMKTEKQNHEALTATNYHGVRETFAVGDCVTHYADNGEIYGGRILSISDGLLNIQFTDGDEGWESAATCAFADIEKRKCTDFTTQHLAQLLSKTVVGISRDGEAGGRNTVYGLHFDDDSVAWILCDPEGNGPGFLDIQS